MENGNGPCEEDIMEQNNTRKDLCSHDKRHTNLREFFSDIFC